MIGARSTADPATPTDAREEAFRNWFAGLVDAMGTFGVYRHTDAGRVVVRVKLIVEMKPGDEKALHAIRERLGGAVYTLGDRCSWQIGSLADAELALRILEGRLRRPSRIARLVPWSRAVEALLNGDLQTAIEAREELRKLRANPPR